MYLHLGEETLVKSEDIVGIFDMDNTTVSKWTRKFLNRGEKAGEIITVTTDIPKTFVVLAPRRDRKRRRPTGKNTIYLSLISSATLKKRTRYLYKANSIGE